MKHRAVFLGLAWFFASATACASETSVALLGGYGVQLDTIIRANRVSSYGPAFGGRWGVTLARRLYLGGTFISHVGTLALARDDAGTSTYRGSYHRSYFGPEIGLDLRVGPVLVRPWMGTGLLVAIDRTSVRHSARSDDALFVYVQPGVLVGAERARWLFGADLRMTIVPAEVATKWAPTFLFVLGRTM